MNSCLRIFAVNRRYSLRLSGCTFLRQSFALYVVGAGSAPPVLPTKSAAAGGAEPRPYKLPRKKVKSIRISSASSIDGNRSTATSIKSDTPVSGGAYQDARKVTIEWNDI